MTKLREASELSTPSLNGCISRYKIKMENWSNGRYFSKYMVKEIIEKYNLKISEIEYYSLIKSYSGIIDIDQPEDNTIEISNKKILEKFPKFS